jgi:hypothetical protein
VASDASHPAAGVNIACVERARRHQRLLSVLAFGLLVLVAELLGHSLTHRIDVGRHVESPSYAGTGYYPFLLAGVKVGIALLLARLVWRVARARRLLAAVGRLHGERAPRPRPRLSPRLWAAVFGLTSLIYLAQADAAGRAALLDPWLHSSALPVFAVLAVVVAFLWGVVQGWLAELEEYVERVVAWARRHPALTLAEPARPAEPSTANPRRLFGLAFESRPPPVTV